ncbi:hypothetical protein FHS30_001202 [Simiduia aestuariiviva]|uniref:Uncharacterized protein n=1 Tax=Simiduia aestuariiviva TaxID=1510459 RepID=A0A839UR46_9GAMM|nr:hypothetical protein [Simiduia aestuariiviva]
MQRAHGCAGTATRPLLRTNKKPRSSERGFLFVWRRGGGLAALRLLIFALRTTARTGFSSYFTSTPYKKPPPFRAGVMWRAVHGGIDSPPCRTRGSSICRAGRPNAASAGRAGAATRPLVRTNKKTPPFRAGVMWMSVHGGIDSPQSGSPLRGASASLRRPKSAKDANLVEPARVLAMQGCINAVGAWMRWNCHPPIAPHK